MCSLLTLSCQKEETITENPNDTATLSRNSQADNSRRHHPSGFEGDSTLILYDTIIPGTVITIGVGDSMQINSIDRDLYAYDYQREILNIDVNSDDENDITLEVSYSPASMGTSERKISYIKAVHDKIAFNGIIAIDTSYIYMDTTGFNINLLQTCHFAGASDDTLIRSNFRCNELLYLDKLYTTETFVPDSVSFIYTESGHGYNLYGDYNVFWNSVNNCHSLPYYKEIYIGFKYTDTIERLGWIKLRLVSTREMFVNEWAIQKIFWQKE